MLKTFILFLMFEPSANQSALYHMEFSSRQSCEAAKVTVLAKAKQPMAGKTGEALKIIDATCLEK